MTLLQSSQASPPASAIVPKCPANKPPMAMMPKKMTPTIAAMRMPSSMDAGSVIVNG